MAKAQCYCGCHQTALADGQSERQLGKTASAWLIEQKAAQDGYPVGVPTDDYVSCVMACDRCRVFHKAAYLAPPPGQQTKWVDPPIQPPPATGCSDESDDGN